MYTRTWSAARVTAADRFNRVDMYPKPKYTTIIYALAAGTVYNNYRCWYGHRCCIRHGSRPKKINRSFDMSTVVRTCNVFENTIYVRPRFDFGERENDGLRAPQPDESTF